jgi:hypothetical protein
MIKKAMGEIRKGDRFLNPYIEEPTVETLAFSNQKGLDNLIRIPLTIDDSSPEASKRSLWGMLEGRPKSLSSDVYGEAYTRTNTVGIKHLNSYEEYVGSTPEEAILKALCHQEGVEV